MKFSFFHLMPWTDLAEAPTEWPAPNGAFNGERGTELLRRLYFGDGLCRGLRVRLGGRERAPLFALQPDGELQPRRRGADPAHEERQARNARQLAAAPQPDPRGGRIRHA